MKLFIDSSTSYLYLAVIKDNNECSSFTRSGKCDHSETLAFFLKEFLEKERIKPTEVTDIFIGRGPGSYTGLRIAGTIGKVFAFTTNINLYSFSSLDLLLVDKIENDGKYLALTQAKKGASYAKAIVVEGKNVKVTLDECFLDNSELDQYDDYEKIIPCDDFFTNKNHLALNIIKYKLYQKESSLDYVPNYMRNVI